MQNITLQKTETRKRVLATRDAIPPEERVRKSGEICEQLIQMLDDFRTPGDSLENRESCALGDSHACPTPHSIAVYHAMKSEVDLDRFILEAYARGIQVYFPCMTKETRTNVSRETFSFAGPSAAPVDEHPSRSSMVFRRVSADAYIDGTATFIAKPLKSFGRDALELEVFPSLGASEASSLDMIIVPLVAFDEDGNRLGYGGGNYDQFLTCVGSKATVVGVGFAEQRIEHVPTEPYDQRLPHIIWT